MFSSTQLSVAVVESGEEIREKREERREKREERKEQERSQKSEVRREGWSRVPADRQRRTDCFWDWKKLSSIIEIARSTSLSFTEGHTTRGGYGHLLPR